MAVRERWTPQPKLNPHWREAMTGDADYQVSDHGEPPKGAHW